MRLVIFGVSNLLGDILDCAVALKLEPSLIVMNMPEITRARTRTMHDRLELFPDPPKIIPLDEFRPREGECYFVGTTSPERWRLVEVMKSRFGITCCALVHPSACVSPRSRVADGVFIGAGSVVGSGAELREHVFVNRKVSIGHDTIVEAYATLHAGCNVAGHVIVGRGATVGIGANVIHELHIGAESSIAAGAVVIEDVPARVLVAGVPAQLKKRL